MERVKSGITGLDDLVEGGIPKGSSFLVSGGSGTGKTIFAMQYLYRGALENKEPGLFVTLETNLKNIVWNMESFRWDIRSLQEKNMMRIYRLNLSDASDTKEMQKKIDEELKVISKLVEEIGAKRLAIDSITALGIWMPEQARVRNMLYRFTDKLKDLDCTTLLTTETTGLKTEYSSMGVEEFVVDGIVALYFSPPNRSIFVKKMRGTNQSKYIHPFEITGNGVTINPKDRVMWDSIK